MLAQSSDQERRGHTGSCSGQTEQGPRGLRLSSTWEHRNPRAELLFANVSLLQGNGPALWVVVLSS